MRFKNPLKWPIYLQTLFAMILGGLIGTIFGKEAVFLGQYSRYLIDLIKFIATPLLFFAIFETIINAELKGKGVVWMFSVSTINGLAAILIALSISNFFKPGLWMPLKSTFPSFEFSQHNLLSDLTNLFPKNSSFSFFSGTTAAIGCAIGLGLFYLFFEKIFSTKEQGHTQKFKSLIQKILVFHFKLIEWMTHLVPFAVFCAVAKVVGSHGFSLIGGLSAYFIACVLGMFLQVFLVYHTWILWIAKIPFKFFWHHSREAVINAFGVNSSLATLPITLKSLKNLKVSDSSARLAACVGTNFNNDGILLYEVVAALFMVQAYGHDLTLLQEGGLAVICIFATLGVAGIPEAGMISLTLVIGTLGLPTQDLPLLLTVDWVLGRLRSVTNVLGDMTGAIAIDWCTNKTTEKNKIPKQIKQT